MSVVGVGVDVVDVSRLSQVLTRTPGVLRRVFTEAEAASGRPERLAARFAAKEAVAKALGCPAGLSWHDVEVVSSGGRPSVVLRGAAARAATALAVGAWSVSLSHDAGVAVAFVVAEGRSAGQPGACSAGTGGAVATDPGRSRRSGGEARGAGTASQTVRGGS